MKTIELYINGKLCDTGNPDDFSVFLKRQLLSPSELSSKDTQRSYDITLPASPINNEILKHVNVEEVKSKFSSLYNAVLIIGGVKIFEGKFKLTEITPNEYRGNLGTPVRTVKDIFGEKNMNETGKWEVEFHDGKDITRYNRMENPDFFFPLVMYGLLAKDPLYSYKNTEDNEVSVYSGKRFFDENVRLGVEDMPASLNCLAMLRRIFQNQGVRLSGSAFSDSRLSKLYVSYKNPDNYSMPWNYGDLAKMQIKGVWSNMWNKGLITLDPSKFERHYHTSPHPIVKDGDPKVYTANLLYSTNARKLYPAQDALMLDLNYSRGYDFSGSQISEYIDNDTYQYTIRIPHSGYYKIELDGSLFIPNSEKIQLPFVSSSINKALNLSSGYDYNLSSANESDHDKYLNASRYELKLIRDRNKKSFDLDKGIDGTYFKNNYDQEWVMSDNNTDGWYIGSTNKGFFPPLNDDIIKNGKQVLFVDPAQNPNMVIGFQWGRFRDTGGGSHGRKRWQQHINDQWAGGWDEEINNDIESKALWATVLAAKSTSGLNKELGQDKRSRVIIHNEQGYTTNVLKGSGSVAIDDFTINLLDNSQENNPCISYSKRRVYEGSIARSYQGYDPAIDKLSPIQCGSGKIKAIAWFDKGEILTLVSSSDYGFKGTSWVWHMIEFDLKISPYRIDKSYGKLNPDTGQAEVEAFYWDEKPVDEFAFRTGNIDLIKFLPSNVKVDDWISNFCKAFNLELIQVDNDTFELNQKKRTDQNTSFVIDLDRKANVTIDRKNVPLGLPGTFKIGFTCDKDEYGYYSSTLRFDKSGDPIRNPIDDSIKQFDAEDGGGLFQTGSVETNTVEHKSDFSYNWMIDLEVEKNNKKTGTVTLPVISDKEIWEYDNSDYGEMMLKSYTDKAQRFWYKDSKTHPVIVNKTWNVEAALVKNAINGAQPMVLDYKNQPHSIMQNYFTVLADADNCFTTVECFLSPEEYAIIDRALIRFNGDLYYVTEVDGYDPLCKKKAMLKLIRKML